MLSWLGGALCLLLVAVWIASLFVGVRRGRLTAAYELVNGKVTYEQWILVGNNLPPPRAQRRYWQLFAASERFDDPDRHHFGYWEVPLWRPTLMVGVPAAALWLLEAFALDGAEIRRRKRGRCPKCGYDRRGIAAEARCPECGAAAA
jgi:hypothetical protein